MTKNNRQSHRLADRLTKGIHQYNLMAIVLSALVFFIIMTSMVVALPYMFYLNQPSEIAHEYTAAQARGRELYMNLGCFYCHSQFVRTYDWAIGNVSESGDYVYDSPHALGTERTGPDLAQIGGMRPTMWQLFHDTHPRSESPQSIMPDFAFLTDQQLSDIIAYVQDLGADVNSSVSTSGNLDTMNHLPTVPLEYQNASNPYSKLMNYVVANYDSVNETYSGDPLMGQMWATIFDQGKTLFTRDCLACHGCSGNGQGPYARHVVTTPADLNERISRYPSDSFHFWRVSEGVPGSAMPAWKYSLNETARWQIITYEMSFSTKVPGAIRTISGDISDAEGDAFANATHITPRIAGTQDDFTLGQQIFNLYCAQCHGVGGQGDGPASLTSPDVRSSGGYIVPEPANFTESGSDFQLYGRYVWKVTQGVETTNMPPWGFSLSSQEIYRVIFYVQTFSTPADYNAKWGPMYSSPFAQNLKK